VTKDGRHEVAEAPGGLAAVLKARGFDTWPVWVQHLVVAVVPSILAYVASEVVPGLPSQYAMLVGLVVAGLTAWLTPLVQAYGVGATNEEDGPHLSDSRQSIPPGGDGSAPDTESLDLGASPPSSGPILSFLTRADGSPVTPPRLSLDGDAVGLDQGSNRVRFPRQIRHEQSDSDT
jgi:hypothetical protein